MNQSITCRRLGAATATALLAAALAAPGPAAAAQPGYMGCIVNRTGNNPRFFYTKVFPADLENRAASAQALEKMAHTWSSGRYNLEANCVWHEIRSVVVNKMADIVNDVESANVDTFEVEGFRGAP